MRGSNPVLSDRYFGQDADRSLTTEERMTARGSVGKTFALLFIAVAAASLPVARYYDTGSLDSTAPYLIGGLIGGLIFALITVFKPKAAPWTAPIYAGLEGLFLGAISTVFEAQYPGIVIQAIGLTFAVTLVMLFLYQTRIIKVTAKLRAGIIGATLGVLVFYVVVLLLALVGVNVGVLFDSGPLAIVISLAITAIAAANLLLDFDFIEHGEKEGAPKYMEWFAAFGLMVTLVWLYIRMLNLLAQLRR